MSDSDRFSIEHVRQERLKPLLDRTVKGYGGIAHPRGWDTIVLELHAKLVAIYPEYQILQTKEKFGALRFYVRDMVGNGFAFIEETEERSKKTCENCGKPGKLRDDGHWLTTLCDDCQEDREKARR